MSFQISIHHTSTSRLYNSSRHEVDKKSIPRLRHQICVPESVQLSLSIYPSSIKVSILQSERASKNLTIISPYTPTSQYPISPLLLPLPRHTAIIPSCFTCAHPSSHLPLHLPRKNSSSFMNDASLPPYFSRFLPPRGAQVSHFYCRASIPELRSAELAHEE